MRETDFRLGCKGFSPGTLVPLPPPPTPVVYYAGPCLSPSQLHRVPGEIKKIKRSKRREVELDPQVCPEEITNREVELG